MSLSLCSRVYARVQASPVVLLAHLSASLGFAVTDRVYSPLGWSVTACFWSALKYERNCWFSGLFRLRYAPKGLSSKTQSLRPRRGPCCCTLSGMTDGSSACRWLRDRGAAIHGSALVSVRRGRRVLLQNPRHILVPSLSKAKTPKRRLDPRPPCRLDVPRSASLREP